MGRRSFGTYDAISGGTVNGANGLWVVQDGKVALTYDGFVEDSESWWYCKDGRGSVWEK